MASPGQLVKCVAEAFGIPAATVAMHDRALADAGLRTMGGRGPSAPKVTPLDAAHLMIAVAATPIAGAAIANSADQCRLYAALPASDRKGKPLGWPDKNIVPACLRDLPAGHTVAQALASVISAACDEAVVLGTRGGGPDRFRGFNLYFAFYAPAVRVIVSSLSGTGKFEAVDYHERRNVGADEGLTQERKFSHTAIAAVARLLSHKTEQP